MENIGCVIYTETSDGLNAEWVLSSNEKISSGTGVAIRLSAINENRKFEGEYEIVYSDINGIESPKLRLNISFESDYYKLTWVYNGKVTELGIGIESNNKLSAGLFKV